MVQLQLPSPNQANKSEHVCGMLVVLALRSIRMLDLAHVVSACLSCWGHTRGAHAQISSQTSLAAIGRETGRLHMQRELGGWQLGAGKCKGCDRHKADISKRYSRSRFAILRQSAHSNGHQPPKSILKQNSGAAGLVALFRRAADQQQAQQSSSRLSDGVAWRGIGLLGFAGA